MAGVNDNQEYLPEYRLKEYSQAELDVYSLEFPVYESPKVSVIIPVYNELAHTLHCLQSVRQYQPEVSYEIIVADDCSTDRTEEVLKQVKGLRYIRNPENLRFLRSCNRVVDFARGEFVFLLNNDTMVTEGWLDELLVVFDRYPDAGLVGSKLLFPDGLLQEAGGIIWSDASGWNYGRNDEPQRAKYCYLKEVDYVSGAAILFPKALFLELGKFDERFAPAYYEEADLAFQIRAAGKKVYFQPESKIVHYEGISNGTNVNAGIKKYQLDNKDKFYHKWKETLSKENFTNGEKVFWARDRSRNKELLLFFIGGFSGAAQNSRALMEALSTLAREGKNIKIVADSSSFLYENKIILQKQMIEFIDVRDWATYKLEIVGGSVTQYSIGNLVQPVSDDHIKSIAIDCSSEEIVRQISTGALKK